MTTADLEQLEHELPPGEPVDKKIAGQSPTRIAFERLRKDKVAVICSVVVLLLVLWACSLRSSASLWGIYPDNSDPASPRPARCSSFDTFPAIGPPYYAFTWEHPLGLAPRTGYDNLARLLYGLRTSLSWRPPRRSSPPSSA